MGPLQSFLDRLLSQNSSVILVELPALDQTFKKPCLENMDCPPLSFPYTPHPSNSKLRNALLGKCVTYLDYSSYYCNNANCNLTYCQDMRCYPMMYDTLHFYLLGAAVLGERLAAHIPWALQQALGVSINL